MHERNEKFGMLLMLLICFFKFFFFILTSVALEIPFSGAFGAGNFSLSLSLLSSLSLVAFFRFFPYKHVFCLFPYVDDDDDFLLSCGLFAELSVGITMLRRRKKNKRVG